MVFFPMRQNRKNKIIFAYFLRNMLYFHQYLVALEQQAPARRPAPGAQTFN